MRTRIVGIVIAAALVLVAAAAADGGPGPGVVQAWAYTPYGLVGRPFIHALDTRHVEAVCVDLPWKSSPKRIYEYRLGWDRAGLLVVRGRKGHILLTVRRDFAT